MNDKHDDALRALYQKSRQEQPAGQLDQRIRKAAERRIYRTRKRWVWGLSTAAVVVLSFNIVLNLVDIEPASKEVLTEYESRFQSPGLNDSTVKEEPSFDAEQSLPQSLPSAPAPVVRTTDKPVLLQQEKHVQKSKQRMLIVPHTSETRQFERDFSSGMAAADRAGPQLVIPELPLQMDELLKLDGGLSGLQTDTGLMTIYADNKLILTVRPLDGWYEFKAWPGAQLLGVRIDWNIKPSQLDQCNTQNAYISCSLNDRVQGLFEQERLDHISWKVVHE